MKRGSVKPVTGEKVGFEQGSVAGRGAMALTREIVVAGGLALAWMLACVPVVLLTPWAGALFVTGLTILLVAVHVWIPRRRGREDLLTALRARRLPSPRSWVLAAVLLTPVWALTLALAYNQLFPIPDVPPNILTIYAEEEGGWLAVTILIVLFGPIVEEFALRGWIQGSLERRFSPAVAITVAAFLYALLHNSAEGFLLFFCIGAFFGWAVWQSGSIWAGVLLHSAYNASLLMGDALLEAGVGPLRLDPEVEFGGIGLVLLFVVMASAVTGVVSMGRRAGRTWGPQAIGLTADGLGS